MYRYFITSFVCKVHRTIEIPLEQFVYGKYISFTYSQYNTEVTILTT